jgi:hypothetical protein
MPYFSVLKNTLSFVVSITVLNESGKRPRYFACLGFFCLMVSQAFAVESNLAPWIHDQGDREVHIFLHEKGEKANVKFSTVELHCATKYFDFRLQRLSSSSQGDYVSLVSYYQWFQWEQASPRNRYSSEFATYGKQMVSVFQQFHHYVQDDHFSLYLLMNYQVADKKPMLHYQSSTKGIDMQELPYADLYTEEMLVPLLRKMLWDKIDSKEINLLGNLSNPPGNFQVQYASIQVKDQYFSLKDFDDMAVVLVEVKRDDGRTASFWFSRNGSHRLVKAILHDGAVLSLIDYKRL